MTPERWHQIKHLVNSALGEEAEARTTLLQQSCADDFALRLGAEALLSATRQLPDAPLAPDQWQRIEQLFQSALELEPSKRAAFLAQACGSDEALRHEIESLLVYQGAAGGLIEGAVHEAAGLLPHDDKARFTPGTTLNKRYRILGQLGKGGMGEVYRADDLKLGQPVALKFLTAKLSHDKAMLARFHSEVAMAHRVTHPNVCRVHDIGEVTTSAGNLHFLSMEYVDGEDLSSLLRRIGRLPSDKAVEIANQLCAGLAAAHEAGVLHRDLKPANVMLDGKGRVRITDFGLAGFAEQFKGQDVFAGTPAYMSPEQFAGKEITTKSDIYALGLVLYEIFTGKRVFEAGSLEELKRMHESSAPTTPSSWVKDIDPLVERVILRCLEKDPAKRLASAKQVADALPGGDPLAAALAMGETPSPEMVAAAGQKTGMKPMYAVACLLAIIIGLVAVAFLSHKFRLIEQMPFDNPPEVLTRKARDMLNQFGYADRPADTAYGFTYDREYLNYQQTRSSAAIRWSHLTQGRPAAIYFWYRESPQYLQVHYIFDLPDRPGGIPLAPRVKENDPSQIVSGMLSIRLDTLGRLLRFSAVPPQIDESNRAGILPSQPNWKLLFTAAGLDPTRLTETEPMWAPLAACDMRAAWTGTFAEQPEIPLRIEAAAWHGKPVYFEIISPWTKPDRMMTEQMTGGLKATLMVVFGATIASLIGIAFLARRNLRQSKSDRRGAFRMAIFMFASVMLSWLAGASHVPTVHELRFFIEAIGMALMVAFYFGLAYLALEPYVRRRWPGVLISWSRLLAGTFRDALVGQDLLIGFAFGIILMLLRTWLIADTGAHDGISNSLLGARSIASQFLMLSNFPIAGAFFYLAILFLLTVLFRRRWLVLGLFILFGGAQGLSTGSWAGVISFSVPYVIHFIVLTRYGLVAEIAVLFVIYTLNNFPITTDFSRWYAGTSLSAMLVVLALAGFAFYTSLGGQKVFAGKLLDE